MQQRYYDPIIGRFYSNDPVGFKASNPMMFNRYAYANNNPYKYIDPDGRESYLVGRPLKGFPGRLAGHQYVVSHARYVGDTGDHVQFHSYGQNADGMLGKLSPENEGKLSRDTTTADRKHWASLAEGSAFVSQITAADDVVADVANSVVADTPYKLPAVHYGKSGSVGIGVQVGAAQLPSASSVLNSNSAATAVANVAAGAQVAQPKSPGAFGYPGADRSSEIKFKEGK